MILWTLMVLAYLTFGYCVVLFWVHGCFKDTKMGQAVVVHLFWPWFALLVAVFGSELATTHTQTLWTS